MVNLVRNRIWWTLRRIVAGTVVACPLVCMAGCGGGDDTAIVGLWSGACSDSPGLTFTGRPFSIEFEDDSTFIVQSAGARMAGQGRFVLAGGEQIILMQDGGATNSGGYVLDGPQLALTGLVDPDSSRPAPAWCRLTRVHS